MPPFTTSKRGERHGGRTITAVQDAAVELSMALWAASISTRDQVKPSIDTRRMNPCLIETKATSMKLGGIYTEDKALEQVPKKNQTKKETTNGVF